MLRELWQTIPAQFMHQLDLAEASMTISRLDEQTYNNVLSGWIPDPVREPPARGGELTAALRRSSTCTAASTWAG